MHRDPWVKKWIAVKKIDCFIHNLGAFLDIYDISEIYSILIYCSIFQIYFLKLNGPCGLIY